MTMKLDAFETNVITQGLRQMGIDSTKCDALGIWTTNQLKQILTRQYEQAYPNSGALAMFPVTTEIAPTTRTFEYHVFDGAGIAQIIADYTDDLPTIEALATVETGKVHRMGNAFLISIDEIKVGQALGSSLSDRKMTIAREEHEALVDRLVFKGSAPHKIVSVFNHPNIPKTVAADEWGTDAAAAEAAAEALQDLVDSVNQVTLGRHNVTDIVLPPSKRKLLAKRMPETTQSYLQWFQDQNNGITITANAELEDIDGAGTKAVLVYEKNPMNMSIEIPEAFNALPMQPKDLHFKVPCTSKATGLIVYRPLTLAILAGI